jgi:hypothetical protein
VWVWITLCDSRQRETEADISPELLIRRQATPLSGVDYDVSQISSSESNYNTSSFMGSRKSVWAASEDA